jgi:glyoxylase-like metal-dependent hydrolase (beta-lactamase superfamily II)
VDLIIESRSVAPFHKNGYVVACGRTRHAVLIDPGDEIDALLRIVETERLAVASILLTHAHVDHVSGVARAKRATGARIGVHRDDEFLYKAAVEQGRMFGYALEPPPPPDFDLAGSGPVVFGDLEAHVHHTPGHSPGGVCLRVEGPGTTGMHLFVGDTLFAGSIGRTDLPGGDYDTLMRSIRSVLFAFDDEAIVHSGHGPDTTIGRERATNPFLRPGG